MQITIVNRQKKIPVRKQRIKVIVRQALKILKLNPSGRLTVLYTDNESIRQLNRCYAKRDEPTDVLCFDLSEKGRILADIAISAEKAIQNSRRFKTTPKEEAALYLIHGLLHLFGYTDKNKTQRQRMQRKALYILNKLNN